MTPNPKLNSITIDEDYARSMRAQDAAYISAVMQIHPELQYTGDIEDYPTSSQPLSFMGIVATTAFKYGVTIRAILAKGRRQRVVRAREEVAWTMCHVMGMGRSQAGRLLNRDHSTVYYLCNRYSKRIAK